jgi:phosphate transport system permease protein
MLGFGRAFGETMIVLMVTGNTAISDWNILEGLRSMTANLAIELSEASSDSSHFNILFLTAGILFIFTFIVNTAAEILRNRLRLLYNYA